MRAGKLPRAPSKQNHVAQSHIATARDFVAKGFNDLGVGWRWGTDHEGGAFDKQTETDRFERSDGCFRQTPIEIIDDDNELVYIGGVEQHLELFPERKDLLRRVIRLFWRVLDIFPCLLSSETLFRASSDLPAA